MHLYTVFYANLVHCTLNHTFPRASLLPDGAYALRMCGQWYHVQSMDITPVDPEDVPPQTRLTALLLGL